eukprot:scaffold180367_cov19-Tisochrysis_lutea.AAC.1
MWPVTCAWMAHVILPCYVGLVWGPDQKGWWGPCKTQNPLPYYLEPLGAGEKFIRHADCKRKSQRSLAAH